jgi:hypothetical protein
MKRMVAHIAFDVNILATLNQNFIVVFRKNCRPM